MATVDLPPEIAGVPFTVGTARAHGLRHCDLRALGLHRPTQAVRSVRPPASLEERATAFAAALPADAAFSHATAALLLGLPLPRPLEVEAGLHVIRPSWRSATRRRGCIGHRGLEVREVVRVGGLRVTGPADTWCDLGEQVGPGLGLDDLVVVADAVLPRLGGPDPRGVLGAVLGARVRPRGGLLLEAALGLSRTGSRSPMETRTRLVVTRAGLPEPELNAVVHDRAGEWLLEGDLVWRKHRVVAEYQGSDHASRPRRSADAHRAGLARDEGWTLVEVFAEDVVPGPRRRLLLLRLARELGVPRADLVLD